MPYRNALLASLLVALLAAGAIAAGCADWNPVKSATIDFKGTNCDGSPCALDAGADVHAD